MKSVKSDIMNPIDIVRCYDGKPCTIWPWLDRKDEPKLVNLWNRYADARSAANIPENWPLLEEDMPVSVAIESLPKTPEVNMFLQCRKALEKNIDMYATPYPGRL